jgi:hypothetical protein
MLASDETPGSRREATGVVALPQTPIHRKVRKTHNELHEEVFRQGAPVKEFVERVGGYQAQGRARSGTVGARYASPPTTSSSPSLPPVPPLPISNQASPRIASSIVATQERGLLSHPEAARDPSTDQPISSSSHIASPTDVEGPKAQSNSLTNASLGPRRDHGHPKQGHRPRDSLVLEKARLIDQLHALRKISILK